MSATTATTPSAPAGPKPTAAGLRRLRPGWMTIASKELSDHVLSVRFYVLLIVVGVAALIPLYFAAERIRSVAAGASGTPSLLPLLFTVAPEGINFGPLEFTVRAFVAIAAPLLGVAFGFDAVNGERHQGTLPRLLSQPIHRDDVINGKFAAGLITITLALGTLVAFVVGFGMLRLGIMPDLEDILRVLSWFAITVLYTGMWLAFGLLLSVVIRRAATSALVGFGVWLFVAIPFFGPLVVAFVGRLISSGAPLERLGTIEWLQRLLPGQVYIESTSAMLRPDITVLRASEQFSPQYGQQLSSTMLTFDQSLLLIWPHIVIMLALTIGCFALAYAQFMRQEVRA